MKNTSLPIGPLFADVVGFEARAYCLINLAKEMGLTWVKDYSGEPANLYADEQYACEYLNKFVPYGYCLVHYGETCEVAAIPADEANEYGEDEAETAPVTLLTQAEALAQLANILRVFSATDSTEMLASACLTVAKDADLDTQDVAFLEAAHFHLMDAAANIYAC